MKVALHSVGYSGVWGGKSVLTMEQFIQKAEALGFDGIELMGKRPHLSPLDIGKKRRIVLKEEIASSGLELPCIASYHDFSTGLEHPDMAVMEKDLVYLREILEMASDLECLIVRVYSGYLHSGVPYEKQWEWCVEGLKEACRLAEEYGVTIGLQNHSAVASYTDEILQLLGDVGSPQLKVVLDAPLLFERKEDLRDSVLKFRDTMVHTHTSDFRHVHGRTKGDFFTFRRVIAVPMGTGEVDYPTFISALKEIGYGGYLSYEMCCRLEGGPSEENLDRLAINALSYTRSLIKD